MYTPLEGIRVVDFSTAGAGPSCTKLLSEYGADVVLIEPLCGNSTRAVLKTDFYNTGKRSLALDAKTPEGMAIIHRLLSDADVFVSNYRTKALRRLGLDYDALRERYPRLVYGAITGYGEDGPDADSPGYDPAAFWARSGMLRDIGEKGRMLPTSAAIGDIATGQALCGGICAALYQREKTGRGDKVFTSLLAEAVYLNHDAVIQVQYGDEYPVSRKAPRRALTNTYLCADGRWLVMAVIDFEKHFKKLMCALGRADLADDPRWRRIDDTMYAGAPELVAILDDAFAKLTLEEALSALRAIDVPVSPVRSTLEMLDDPQCAANHQTLDISCPDGKVLRIPANPVKFTDSGCGVTGFRLGPDLGADSAEILRERGYTEAEIAELAGRGVVRIAR